MNGVHDHGHYNAHVGESSGYDSGQANRLLIRYMMSLLMFCQVEDSVSREFLAGDQDFRMINFLPQISYKIDHRNIKA
jgi:hypothetical protein